MTKTNALSRLALINNTHAHVLSAGGALFERDAIELQSAQDEVFSLCTDEDILAIVHPMLGQVYDQCDIDMIREEISKAD